jgi:hypothetical protein
MSKMMINRPIKKITTKMNIEVNDNNEYKTTTMKPTKQSWQFEE